MEQGSPPMDDSRRQMLVDSITTIKQSMDDIAAQGFNKMPERVFVHVYLPLFAGEPVQYAVNFTTWATFAGNEYREVSVIDTQGNVLFNVPPLLDRSAVDSIGSDEARPIAHMVASAQQYSRMSPQQGINYLDAELTKRALIMKAPADVMKNLEIWNQIFIRYGRAPILKTASPEAEKVKVEAAKVTNYDDYELL